MKYRYRSIGSFTPETYGYSRKDASDTGLYIEIPSSFAHEKKEMAEADSTLAYRFISVGGEVVIAIFPQEKYSQANLENGTMQPTIWTEGDPCYFLDYEQFKDLGGNISEYVIPELRPMENTFNELLPDLMPEDGYIYIDGGLSDWSEEGV